MSTKKLMFKRLVYLNFACAISVSSLASQVDANKNNTLTNESIMVDTFAKEICDAELVFDSQVITKTQTLKPKANVEVVMHQLLTSENIRGVTIASNIICQQLKGAKYTGSDQEWAQFIQNAAHGLKRAKAEGVKLFLTGDQAKVYPSLKDNKEYDFEASIGGNKQIFKNIAILDKERNTVYTISVSGSTRVEKLIKEEFSRLVKSFRLLNK